MNINTQIILKNNPNLTNYLHYNSNYYKDLNRDYNYINVLNNNMLDDYKLKTSDRIEEFTKKIETFSQLLEILK